MNRLNAELQRLYFHTDLESRTPSLSGPDGRVRAAVAGFGKAADWPLVAQLCQRIVEDLDLPSPAVSISERGGYRLWFSFSEPVAADRVAGFLALLRQRYLGDAQPGHLELWPAGDGASPAQAAPPPLPPVADAESGKWSAFIDPELGSLFSEEPGLDMAPSDDRQAELLTGFKSIRCDAFADALTRLGARTEAAGAILPEEVAFRVGAPVLAQRSPGEISFDTSSDPKAFLLAVMNDPAADLGHRIEAAKVLLPWFEGEPRR